MKLHVYNELGFSPLSQDKSWNIIGCNCNIYTCLEISQNRMINIL